MAESGALGFDVHWPGGFQQHAVRNVGSGVRQGIGVRETDNHLPAGPNLAAGAWVIVSPWALGFTGQANAMWTHLVVGGLIVIVASIRLGARGQVPASSRL